MLLSNHARKQLKERNISLELVAKALSAPEETISADDGRTIFHYRFKEDEKTYILRVIAENIKSDWLIITVYKSSKIEKYWRGDLQ